MKRVAVVVLGLGLLGYGILRSGGGDPVAAPETVAAREPSRTPPDPVQNQNPIPQGGVVEAKSEDALASETPSEDLKSELERVSQALPRMTAVKGLNEEQVAHRAPPLVMEAGAALGDLAEYLEKRPNEFKNATPFYAKCALDEQLMPAARAMCLHALSQKPAEWAKGVKESVDRVPAEIADLASQL